MDAIERHTERGIIDAIVANSNLAKALPEEWQSSPVPLSRDGAEIPGVQVVEADVVAEHNRYRHDPDKLAATILRLYDGREPSSMVAARQQDGEALLISR